jgi:hypothetical protein
VSLPAVEAGLGLDERVVRRHVAKLERMGWLGRAPWIWGEGSVAWLTSAGIDGVGLGGIRPIKAPPAPTTIAHGVLVGWSAARAEHLDRVWMSARELAVDLDRWAVPARRERGEAERLPDLAVWVDPAATPGAVIAESGGRREDRQKMILEGWRDAVYSGRYFAVRYDCASESIAHWITRLATKVGLTSSDFGAFVQLSAEQIGALSPAVVADEPMAREPALAAEVALPEPEAIQATTVASNAATTPSQPAVRPSPAQPEHDVKTVEAAAERERISRELFGMGPDPPRRRWRRG